MRLRQPTPPLKATDLSEEMPPNVGLTEKRLAGQRLLVRRPAAARTHPGLRAPPRRWRGRLSTGWDERTASKRADLPEEMPPDVGMTEKRLGGLFAGIASGGKRLLVVGVAAGTSMGMNRG
jgi:hypothetical protein